MPTLIKTATVDDIINDGLCGFQGGQKYEIEEEGINYSFGRTPVPGYSEAYKHGVDSVLLKMGWRIHNGTICRTEIKIHEALACIFFKEAYDRVSSEIIKYSAKINLVVDPVLSDISSVEEFAAMGALPERRIALGDFLKEVDAAFDATQKNEEKAFKKDLTPELFVKIVYDECAKIKSEKGFEDIEDIKKLIEVLESNGFISTELCCE